MGRPFLSLAVCWSLVPGNLLSERLCAKQLLDGWASQIPADSSEVVFMFIVVCGNSCQVPRRFKLEEGVVAHDDLTSSIYSDNNKPCCPYSVWIVIFPIPHPILR